MGLRKMSGVGVAATGAGALRGSQSVERETSTGTHLYPTAPDVVITRDQKTDDMTSWTRVGRATIQDAEYGLPSKHLLGD